MNSTLPVRMILSKSQADLIRSVAERAFPEESCGLLVGHGANTLIVTEVVAAKNIADEPTHRFTIDPQVQFDVLRRLRGGHERVIGHFHSHPGGPAALSACDIELADDPEAIWMVMGMNAAGKVLETQAFRCPKGEVPLPITIDLP